MRLAIAESTHFHLLPEFGFSTIGLARKGSKLRSAVGARIYAWVIRGNAMESKKMLTCSSSTVSHIAVCMLGVPLLITGIGCRVPWQKTAVSDAGLSQFQNAERDRANQLVTRESNERRPLHDSEDNPAKRFSSDDVGDDMRSDVLMQQMAALERIGERRNSENSIPHSVSKRESRQSRDRGGEPENQFENEDADAIVYRFSDDVESYTQEPEASRGLAGNRGESSMRSRDRRRSDDRMPTRSAEHEMRTDSGDEVVGASAAPRVDQTDRYRSPVDYRDGESEYRGETSDVQYANDEVEVTPAQWQDSVREAITTLEKQVAEATNPERRVNLEKTRRLLDAAVNDLDHAMIPIQGLDKDVQDFMRHSIQSWHDLTDPSGNPNARRRYTLALQSQRKAIRHLAAASDLEVRNVAFCTAVDSYGSISEFDENVFRPDQELLLYLEVDNFVSLPMPSGDSYETHLKGTYQILDANGNRVQDQQLDADQYICSNPRRDYFIVYRIYTPPELADGRYQLKLTVEDLNGHKFGNAKIDFQIAN